MSPVLTVKHLIQHVLSLRRIMNDEDDVGNMRFTLKQSIASATASGPFNVLLAAIKGAIIHTCR
ncbi:hypothetical protein EM595_2070 [Duffyella gerundensis]|uniref:Uncharacterized protein n=1 Tax=Duffyella gerundensis TaxID=1619313 RepID=A0A0U5L562_9GAMM|nr:hypothetical protein EM595_2070 [Duffyella gerundensis]